jgi:heterodisulfide reductase subunit A-like polyferredoxin
MAEKRNSSSKTKSSVKQKRARREPIKFSNRSIWAATEPELKFPALSKNAKADVCIVGAGIAGLTTGYLLAQEGKSVIIIAMRAANYTNVRRCARTWAVLWPGMRPKVAGIVRVTARDLILTAKF